jgi:AAA domain
LAKKHGWQGWSPPSARSETTASTEPAALPEADGTEQCDSPTSGLSVSFSNIPHRRWLYGVDLIRGEITVLAAPGGVGKSSLAIGMSISLAVGRATLEEKIWDEELTALYLNGEDSSIEMRRRIWAYCLRHHVAEQDLGRLLVAGADDGRVQRVTVDAPMAVSAIHPDEQARVAAAWEASLAGFPASSSNSSWPMKSKKKSGNTAGSSARSASDARPTGVWSLLTTIPNTYQAPFQVHLGSVPDEPEGPKGEP